LHLCSSKKGDYHNDKNEFLNTMKNSIVVFHWLPRILCILAILFVSMFALDSFAPELTIWQQIGAFLMHLIPSFVLLLFLIIAWKWELVGSIIFTATGIGFTPFIYIHNFHNNHSVWISLSIVLAITFPFIVVGVLFFVSWLLKKKEKAAPIV